MTTRWNHRWLSVAVLAWLIWQPGLAMAQPDTDTDTDTETDTETDTDTEPDTDTETETDTETDTDTDSVTDTDTDAESVDLSEIEAALGADAARAEEQETGAGQMASAVQSLNPDIALILDTAVAWFSDDDNLQGGGHDPSEDGFNLQGLEVAIGSAVDPFFRFDSNIVFSQFGVEIEEAYATTLALPSNLQARIGQFLTRIGRHNPTHLHSWKFADQPFVLSRLFGSEGNRGLGAELSYLTPLPWYVEIIGSVTDAGGEATARSFFGGEDQPVDSPLDVQSTLIVEQFFPLHPNWSLLTGTSVATGPNSSGPGNRTDIYAIDLFLKYRPITRASYTEVHLETEYYYRRRQLPRDVLRDHGSFTQASWRMTRHWWLAGRYEWGGAARARFGQIDVDPLDPEWTGNRHRISASATYHPTEFSRLRAQASLDMPAWREDPIAAVFLTTEFAVGAHGAHRF